MVGASLILRERPANDGDPAHVFLSAAPGLDVAVEGGVSLRGNGTVFSRAPGFAGNGVTYIVASGVFNGFVLINAGDFVDVNLGSGPDFDQRSTWTRAPVCGNGILDENESCDGDVGCSDICEDAPGFLCDAVLGCVPALCEKVDLSDNIVPGFDVTGGTFDGTFFGSRLTPLKSVDLAFPVRVRVTTTWESSGIAFVGVRSDGQPATAQEPENSVYLRLHNGIGIQQGDLAVGASNNVVDSRTVPSAPLLFAPYRVEIVDDGGAVRARVSDAALQATTITASTDFNGGSKRVVLSSDEARFSNLEVCHGIP